MRARRGGIAGFAALVLALLTHACATSSASSHSSSSSAHGRLPDGGIAGGGDDDVGPAQTLGLFGWAGAVYWLHGAVSGTGEDLVFSLGDDHLGFDTQLPVAGDFDGDGFDSVGVYGLIESVFHLRNDDSDGADALTIPLGTPGVSLPLSGDFDGDGTDTVGVYEPATGKFTLLGANRSDAAKIVFSFGPAQTQWTSDQGFPTVLATAGDLDGDGKDTVAVYDQATGILHVADKTGEGATDTPILVGKPGDRATVALLADLDGDGKDEIVLYDVVKHTATVKGGTPTAFGSNAFDWIPVAGRWKRAPAQPGRSGYAWPTSTPAAENVDAPQLAAAYDDARKVSTIHSMLVIHHDKLIGEEYFNDYKPEYPQCIKSVSKSILSALYGIGTGRGDLPPMSTPVAQVLPTYFHAGGDARLRQITLNHLLTMSAGLAWDEYTVPVFMTFALSTDPAGYVLSQPVTDTPGSTFSYSTGLSDVGARVIEASTKSRVRDYAKSRLFGPIGIATTRWDHDGLGHDWGGAEVYMPPRDLARFGQLYLHRGTLDGQNVVPSPWVTATTSPVWSEYASWWWVRTTNGHDMFYAWGFGGQFIYVVPDLDLVVVMTSDWSSDNATDPLFAVLDDDVVPAVH